MINNIEQNIESMVMCSVRSTLFDVLGTRVTRAIETRRVFCARKTQDVNDGRGGGNVKEEIGNRVRHFTPLPSPATKTRYYLPGIAIGENNTFLLKSKTAKSDNQSLPRVKRNDTESRKKEIILYRGAGDFVMSELWDLESGGYEVNNCEMSGTHDPNGIDMRVAIPPARSFSSPIRFRLAKRLPEYRGGGKTTTITIAGRSGPAQY